MAEFRLLGPVEVVASGQPVEVGPPQRCAVLAALAVDAGRPVTVETLIDRVWGDQSPERVRRALHAHVTRIRRLLEHAGTADGRPARLLRRPGGYLLDIDPDRVDLHRFRRLCEQARDPDRDDAERVLLLREALRLWHGEPLAGLAGLWVTRTRHGWRQQHLDAVQAWACAELRVDNPAAVIGPLTDLVGEHPLLEALVAVLMRALYAAGHSAEALDLYTATRNRLVEELGAEPGTELQRVHQGILRDDLGKPAPAAAPTPQPSRVVPAQLPRDIRGFAGRRDELTQLDALASAAGEQGTPVVISAVAGTAGVGKTSSGKRCRQIRRCPALSRHNASGATEIHRQRGEATTRALAPCRRPSDSTESTTRVGEQVGNVTTLALLVGKDTSSDRPSNESARPIRAQCRYLAQRLPPSPRCPIE
ncbi:MAG TPA: AfsR/SARP family transcriptional regulator [Micromonosporaceae bacterium]|nr:AfsR/SARP family transcriptional regulator [Micromonosporaceae bacterium]